MSRIVVSLVAVLAFCLGLTLRAQQVPPGAKLFNPEDFGAKRVTLADCEATNGKWQQWYADNVPRFQADYEYTKRQNSKLLSANSELEEGLRKANIEVDVFVGFDVSIGVIAGIAFLWSRRSRLRRLGAVAASPATVIAALPELGKETNASSPPLVSPKDETPNEARTARDVKLIKALAISGWFLILFCFNVAVHLPQNTDKNIEYIVLEAIGSLTSPREIALSALVVTVIVLAGRKPMGER